MSRIVVNFNDFRNSVSDFCLNKEVIKFLARTKKKFLTSNSVHESDKTGFLSLFTSAASSIGIDFSHNLVKSGTNQWHIIENNRKGNGGFGTVNESKLKIIITEVKGNYSAEIVAVNDVVKIQKNKDIPIRELLEAAVKEAQMQRKHGVHVIGVVDDSDKVLTIVADCGVSLDKLLPFNPAYKYSFEHRFAIAARIASEMLLLQQKGVVHRDLKPANICYKMLAKEQFAIIFIDFGLAENVSSIANKDVAGTYYYMAPEVYKGKGSTYASDMYALAAILGELFGAKDILKYKDEAHKRGGLPDLINAPFCFDGILEGFEHSAVDPYLLNDLKRLLVQLGSSDPRLRPTIHEVNKFLITFITRMDLYVSFTAKWKKIEALFLQYETYQNQLYQLQKRQQLAQFATHLLSSPSILANEFNQEFVRNNALIYQNLAQLPVPKSHLELAKKLVKENKTADFLGRDNPYPILEPIHDLLERENKKFSKALTHFTACAQAFTHSNKFEKTNSTGIIEITNVLRSDIPIIEKLQRLKAIGIAKTEKGFWNSFSHSSIFGKGRHAQVDALYHKLAAITHREEEYLADRQLEEITQFINTTDTFVHR